MITLYNVPKVPWLAAEDETAIENVICYHEETDELIGFCGNIDDGNGHKCLTDVRIKIGDDEHSYQKILDSFIKVFLVWLSASCRHVMLSIAMMCSCNGRLLVGTLKSGWKI